jgi:hypothetical protein
MSNAPHRNKFAYGSNAAAMAVLALALIIILNYFFSQYTTRFDLSFGRANDLSPATRKLLQELDAKNPGGKVIIANLFGAKMSRNAKTDEDKQKDENARSVSDLLREYTKNSKCITTINPTARDDVESMIRERFAKESETFETTFKDFDALLKNIENFSKVEGENFSSLAQQKNAPAQIIGFAVYLRLQFVDDIPARIKEARKQMEHESEAVMPHWDVAVSAAKSALSDIDGESSPEERPEGLKVFAEIFAGTKSVKPEAITSDAARKIIEHIKEIAPEITKQRDAIAAFQKKLDALPKPKLSDISLPQESCLVVFPPANGPDAQTIRVVERSKMFTTIRSRPGQPTETFDGESPLSSALLPLVRADKPHVVFVTSGPHDMLARFSYVRRKLEQSNFQVDEWTPPDPMAAMRGDRTPPGPAKPPFSGKDNGKPVIWVVITLGPGGENMFGDDPLGGELRAHLDAGGAVLFLANPSAAAPPKAETQPATAPDNESDAKRKKRRPSRFSYADLIAPFGIEVDPNYSVVSAIQTEDARGVHRSLAIGFVIVSQFPDDPITKPIDSLRTGLGIPFPNEMGGFDLPALPTLVRAIPAAGAKSNVIVSVPKSAETFFFGGGFLPGTSWADANDMVQLTDTANADDPLPEPPLPLAVKGSKMYGPDEQRVVVIGNITFAMDGLVNAADVDFGTGQATSNSLLPGNLELFVNSIMWLAHDENHIAVSAKAGTARRISDISPNTLFFLNWGLLYLGLPALALIAGSLVFTMRRRA